MDRLQTLFRQYLDNRLSPEEFTEFWQLLGQEQDWERLSPELLELWTGKPEHVLADKDWERKMRALMIEKDARPRHISIRRSVVRWVAAAVLLFMLAGGYWLFREQRTGGHQKAGTGTLVQDIQPGSIGAILRFSNGQTILLDTAHNGRLTNTVTKSDSTVSIKGTGIEYATLTTPRARQQQLVLPDGSKVWLDAASSITFPSVFRGDHREVTITGEAFFEIAKDQAKPFVVKVGAAEVQVLGTSFNIMAYSGEASVQTTLVEGAVQIVKGEHTLVLQPGQQGRVLPDGRLDRIDNADIELVTAWKNGWQSFHGANLATIMRQVERWYDVDVEYQTHLPSDMTFSGEIPRNVNLSELLKVFERKDLHFSIDARQHKVIVKP